jgi:hypothetical protein
MTQPDTSTVTLSKEALDFVMKNPEQIEVLAGNADTLSFWYMGDGHWFARLAGKTLDDIIKQAEEIRCRKDGYGYYGMLCPVTLMRKGKEVRRVGKGAHCHGQKNPDKWKRGVAEWKASLEADEQVMRLLEEGKVCDD